jgi:hypothetical protein
VSRLIGVCQCFGRDSCGGGGDHRYLTDFAFLAIIFVASWVGALGVRWNTVSMLR